MNAHKCSSDPCWSCAEVAGLKSYLKDHSRESLEALVYDQACRLDDKDLEIEQLQQAVIAENRRAFMAQMDDSKRDELAAAKLRIIELEAQFSAQCKATGEEMLKRQQMENNWDTMVKSIREHYDAQLKAEAAAAELVSFREEYEIMRKSYIELREVLSNLVVWANWAKKRAGVAMNMSNGGALDKAEELLK